MRFSKESYKKKESTSPFNLKLTLILFQKTTEMLINSSKNLWFKFTIKQIYCALMHKPIAYNDARIAFELKDKTSPYKQLFNIGLIVSCWIYCLTIC